MLFSQPSNHPCTEHQEMRSQSFWWIVRLVFRLHVLPTWRDLRKYLLTLSQSCVQKMVYTVLSLQVGARYMMSTSLMVIVRVLISLNITSLASTCSVFLNTQNGHGKTFRYPLQKVLIMVLEESFLKIDHLSHQTVVTMQSSALMKSITAQMQVLAKKLTVMEIVM